MKDFQTLTGEITDPAIKRTLEKEANLRRAEIAVDCLDAELDEAMKARKRLPAIEAQIKALEAAIARPLSVSASLKAPAKPKPSQKRPSIKSMLSASVAAEFLRRTKQTDPAETIENIFPGADHQFARKITKAMHQKSGTNPASTTSAGWGAELVRSDVLAFWSDMAATSIAGSIVARGFSQPLEFGPNGSLTVPMRGHGTDGDMKPAWMAEGGTIPVVSGSLGSVTMQPYRLSAISVFSDELATTSTPHIQTVCERFILDDSSTVIDETLMSSDATIAGIKPAGLLNGNVPLVADTGPIQDLTKLIAHMAKYKARKPFFVMGIMEELTLRTWMTNGQWTFRDEMEKGTLFGIPFITSSNVAGSITILDGDSLFMSLAVPEVDVSASASIVMASQTDPAPTMGDAATNAVSVANSIQESDAASQTPPAEVRSMLQTSGQAIRIVMPGLSWALMSPDAIATINPTWLPTWS